jgi:hypothetical protein
MSEQPRKTETVKEYIKRGGTITRFPDSPNSFYGTMDDTTTTVKPRSDNRNVQELQRVSWKDIEHDEKIIETDDKYWKAVDAAVDKLMSKYS